MPIVVPELESSSVLQVEDLIKKVFPKKVCVVKKAEKCLQSKKVLVWIMLALALAKNVKFFCF